MSEVSVDEQLVARAQAGDIRAFELLFRKYQHKIVQLVSRLVGDADAPDVAQETFIKAYRALGGFQGNSAFYTWLYRIGINTAKITLCRWVAALRAATASMWPMPNFMATPNI